MNNIKKFSLVLFLVGFLLIGFNITKASASDVNITIRDAEEIIYTGLTPLPDEGTIEIQGHTVNLRSILGVLDIADQNSTDFAITDLMYYDSFGSFYLKCINNKCDDWQYVVDDETPSLSIDQNILAGGEDIYFYFGKPHRISLSDDEIETTETLNVTTEKYNWDDNSWETLEGVTVGITEPNPSDPFSPIEILTSEVDDAGIASFTNIPIGTYDVGIKEDFYFPTETLTVIEAENNEGNNSGGGGSSGSYLKKEVVATKPVFDTVKAFDFLVSKQLEDGSFGEDLYTDWIALALATTQEHETQRTKLIKYLSEDKLENPSLTDFQRRAMAQMALGVDPYLGENYIQKIIAKFDGKQFGEIEQDNDDIFALLILQNSGYGKDDKIISATIDFILSRQLENGSWDNSVDMTGVAIQAIAGVAEKNCSILGSLSEVATPALPLDSSVCETPQNKEFFLATSKAKEFLKQNQKEDGGFGNVSSTTWAMGGILSLGENPTDWKMYNPADGGASTPFDYLAINQDLDGGMKNENIQSKLWETAYSLTAFSGKPLDQIMQKFEKVEIKPIEIEKKAPTLKKIGVSTQNNKNFGVEKKIQNLASEITASPINAIEKEEANTPQIKEKGLKNFFRKIIGFFF